MKQIKGGEMSEKRYSTDELINELEIILTEANAGEAFKFHKVKGNNRYHHL